MDPVESSFGPSTSRRKLDKANCAVCYDTGDGFHFGAEACRACAAFFRRTVALNKEYECRQNGYCTVNTIVRSICKSCRLTKCLEVGMKASCVQPRRDTHGKREEERSQSEPFDPSSDLKIPMSPCLEHMPILERMRINYEKLENARNVIHRLPGENIFEPKIPRPLNFREALDMTSKEVSLVADWIEWCFDEFGILPVDQKTVLFQNFFQYFSVLERAFLTCKFGAPGQMVLASRDYLMVDRLQEFFSDSEMEVSGENLALIFRPAVDLQMRSLHSLITLQNMDWYEFFSLSVLLFWDYGLEGESEECNQIGMRIKMAVSKEITFYLEKVKMEEAPLSRVAMLVAILPSLQRVVNRFREDIQMAHIFDVYTIPPNFFNIVNGRFS